MSIRETINQEIKKAMQAKEELLLLVLRGLNAAFQNKEIEKRTKLSKAEKDIKKLEELSKLNEEEVIGVISGEAKKRRDSIIEFKKGNRNDLVEKEEKELEILKKYLPEQMSEDQVKEEAKKVIAEIGAVGPKDTGKVMSALMSKIKGKAEGLVVSKVVGELLNS
jgi:uncharacterized protein